MSEMAQQTINWLIEGRALAKAYDEEGDMVSGNGIEGQMHELLVRAWFAGWLVPAPDLAPPDAMGDAP